MQVFARNDWSRVYFLQASSYSRCEQGMEVVMEAMRHSSVTVAETRTIDESTLSDDVVAEVLKSIRERSRG